MSGIRVTYSGLIFFVTGLIATITGLIVTTIITRSLNPTEFGIWGLINGLIVYGLVLDPIISFWITREIPRGVKSGATAFASTGGLSVAGIIIYLVISYVVGNQSDIELHILFFAAILIPMRYLFSVLAGINYATRHQIVSYAMLLSEVGKVGMVLFFVYYFNMGISGVIITFFSGYLISNIVLAYFARENLRVKINKNFFKKWFKLSWIPTYPNISSLLYASDVIIFSVITNSVIGIAYYTASVTIVRVIGFAGRISSPTYVKLLEGGKSNYLQDTLNLVFYFVIPLTSITIIFAKAGLYVLNPIYVVANTIVIFLAIRIFLDTLSLTFHTILTGNEKVDMDESSSFKEYIKSKLIFLPTLILIKDAIYLGTLALVLFILNGTASEIELVIYWAILALITQIPITCYQYILVKKEIEIKIDIKSISKFTIAALIAFGFTFFISEQYLDYEKNLFEFIPNVIMFAIIGMGIYLGITYSINQKTRQLFKSIIQEIRK